MKTLIIGGGKGCRSILDLTSSFFLKELRLNVIAVADINPMAPGMIYAGEMGIKTYTDMLEALKHPGLKVVIELTGKDSTLKEIYKNANPGIKIIDHTIVGLFWEIENARDRQKQQLQEMQELERQLEKESSFMQSIFDNLIDLAVVLDRHYRIIKVNKKFSEFLGINSKDIIGKKCAEVIKDTILGCDEDLSDENLERIFKEGKSLTFLRLTQPPNENYWEIVRSPIYDGYGNVAAILATWHRITERVKLHREIESAEQRFKSFINSAEDWISIKDLNGRYVIVNPVTARALNKEAHEFEGKKPEDILNLKLAKMIKKHDSQVINSKKPLTFDEIIPINGEERHFHTVRFPLFDYKGEIYGVCTIQRDRTNEIRLHEQLAQSEKLAALGKLAAGVAHEINNPLTGILAYAEDMQEELGDSKELSGDISVIIRETLRCRDIVRNLLDFARQDKPQLQKSNPNTVVDNAMHLIERLPQFKDVSIQKRPDKNLPDISLDPMQIQQVMLNFMLNAAEAMKFKGEITIQTSYDRKKSSCIISVEDNGPGIPENMIDKIFEPFFSTKGTNGLGLAVSWGIIERHHGTIEIDMSDTGGAIFSIVLPAHT